MYHTIPALMLQSCLIHLQKEGILSRVISIIGNLSAVQLLRILSRKAAGRQRLPGQHIVHRGHKLRSLTILSSINIACVTYSVVKTATRNSQRCAFSDQAECATIISYRITTAKLTTILHTHLFFGDRPMLSVVPAPSCYCNKHKLIQTLPRRCLEDGCTRPIPYRYFLRCFVYGYRNTSSGRRFQESHVRKRVERPRDFMYTVDRLAYEVERDIRVLNNHRGRLSKPEAERFSKMVTRALSWVHDMRSYIDGPECFGAFATLAALLRRYFCAVRRFKGIVGQKENPLLAIVHGQKALVPHGF